MLLYVVNGILYERVIYNYEYYYISCYCASLYVYVSDRKRNYVKWLKYVCFHISTPHEKHHKHITQMLQTCVNDDNTCDAILSIWLHMIIHFISYFLLYLKTIYIYIVDIYDIW